MTTHTPTQFIDAMDIRRTFTQRIFADFVGQVSNTYNKMRSIITEQIFIDGVNKEIRLNVQRGGQPGIHQPIVTITIYEHHDRWYTTGNTRIPIKTYRFDINDDINKVLEDIYKKEIKNLITPNGINVKPTAVPMLVNLDSDKAVDELIPAAWCIDRVEVNEKGYTFRDAKTRFFHFIPHNEWKYSKEPHAFSGDFLVVFKNEQVLVINKNVFNNQFKPLFKTVK